VQKISMKQGVGVAMNPSRNELCAQPATFHD
jgi:hypothetical protein